MFYTERNGIKFSKIALGAAEFGSKVSKEMSFKLMDRYYEQGGNLIDTGRIYANWLPGGANASESTIGEWIKSRGLKGKMRVATKGGHPPKGNKHISRINKEAIEDDMNESLKYLQTDCIDIYYLHRDDVTKPVSEIMPILNNFVKEGKARFIGASNWTGKRIAEANKFAEENGMAKFTFSEIMWSYAKINVEGEPDDTLVLMNDEEYEWYKNNDVNLMCFSSQAQGFYSMAVKNGIDNLPEHYIAKYKNQNNLDRIEVVRRISKETGISPTALGLVHLFKSKDIDAIPIVGGFNMEFLEDSLMSIKTPEKYYEELLK